MADADILALLDDAARRREAFELLVMRYQNKVLRLAYSILGERTAAEDATQDALLRVWRGLDRFRGESLLSTWIYTITRNAALSARKSLGRTDSLEEPRIRSVAEAAPQGAPSHAIPDLMRFVEALPEQQRRVVILFYLENKSYIEVASMLDLPMGTVKTYLHRARKELALAVVSAAK